MRGANHAGVEIGRHKAMALLVYLAVNGGPHNRDVLSMFLWLEQDQSRARANLRDALPGL